MEGPLPEDGGPCRGDKGHYCRMEGVLDTLEDHPPLVTVIDAGQEGNDEQ